MDELLKAIDAVEFAGDDTLFDLEFSIDGKCLFSANGNRTFGWKKEV